MYVQTGSGLKGLSRVRENGGGVVIPTVYERGFVMPIPTATILPRIAPRRPWSMIGKDTISPFPIAPSFEVDAAKFGPVPVKPILPAETRDTTISLPVPSADSKLAFEFAEAQKWGYTHSAWMAMGSGARCAIRSKYPGGYKPVTPSGTTTTAARVDLIEGRDPLRSIENYSGAGDHPGGIEIREPLPSVPLIATKSGITFDDIVNFDSTKIQTAAEAVGVTDGGGIPAQDYVRFALMGLAGYVLWDMFFGKKKPARRRRRAMPPMRRQYPYESKKRHIRQGWQ